MRYLYSFVTLGVLLVVPLISPGAAGASAQARAFSASGEAAEVSFQSVDPSGCVQTFVSLIGVDERVKEDGAPSERRSWAAAIISQVDSCTGAQRIGAVGSADLGPDAFQIDKLDTASLTTTMVMDDIVTGSTFTVEIAVTWEATGEPTRLVEHRQIWEQGLVMNIRTDGTSRPATAWGTVSDGNTNFTPEPGTALISSGRTIDVSVDHD